MMKPNDLENELRNLKPTHLTESELAAYCDQELDQIGLSRAEAHLKQCFICERQLAMLVEESAALSRRQVAADDLALVERLMEQMGSALKPSATRPAGIAKGVPLQERLAEYLRQMVASWRICFGQGALGVEIRHGEDVWRWQSEDRKLKARATMEKNADMIIHFSSTETELEGARLHFRLSELDRQTTLRRVSDSEVAAQVAIPSQYRQSSTADIFIEIV